MVALNGYSRERLVHLLQVLRPAPQHWVTKAQAAISEMLTRDRTRVGERPLTESQLTELRKALERDPAFRQSFEADPVAAAEAAGWLELAQGIEREIRALIALAERIAADDAFRAELDADPVTALEAADMPPDAAESLLRALATPDDLLAKLPDVVAHQHQQEPMRTRLLILLLGVTGVAETLRNLSRRA